MQPSINDSATSARWRCYCIIIDINLRSLFRVRSMATQMAHLSQVTRVLWLPPELLREHLFTQLSKSGFEMTVHYFSLIKISMSEAFFKIILSENILKNYIDLFSRGLCPLTELFPTN